jgi:hypothetical protein
VLLTGLGLISFQSLRDGMVLLLALEKHLLLLLERLACRRYITRRILGLRGLSPLLTLLFSIIYTVPLYMVDGSVCNLMFMLLKSVYFLFFSLILFQYWNQIGKT